MAIMIDCIGLNFSYGELQALQDFSINIRQGEVMALLGPNGAGKTTSIRVLTGLLNYSAGQCRVLGKDPRQDGAAIRAQCGVLTETPALYERLTAKQNLDFFGSLAGLTQSDLEQRSTRLLDSFRLSGRANDRVETFSKGMKQRLALVRALLHDPQLLFLDEPTSDLDPEAARHVQDLILEVSQQNRRTVLLCTHRLFEAERMCSRVAIMRSGTVLAMGTLDELRRQVMPGIRVHFRMEAPVNDAIFQKVKYIKPVSRVEKSLEHGLDVFMSDEAVIPDIVDVLVAAGARIRAVEPQHASLEEIYLRLQEENGEVAQ